MGMTNNQIRGYLQEVLAELNPQYGIKNFEPAAIPNSKIDKGAPIPQDQGGCL